MSVIATRQIDNAIIPQPGGNWLHGVDNGLLHGRFGRVDGVPYCRVGSDPDHWIEFVLQPAKAPALDAVNGNECLFYLGAATDLRLRADGNTLKEEIVIYHPLPLRSAVFEYTLHGVVAGAVADRIKFYAAESVSAESVPDPLFSISDLFAMDAAGRTTPVVALLDEAAGTITLELADAAWWNSATYPVVIDPTVTTTTTIDAIAHSQTRGAYYCNGWWWCAANNGTGGVLYKSTDGITWTFDGQLFASATTTLHDTMLRGSTLHIAGAASNTTSRYRQITLNADGSTIRGTDVSPSPAAAGRVVVGVDSAGLPWVKLKAYDIYVWRNTQTDGQGTWTPCNQDAPSGWSGSYPGDLIAAPDAPGDMLETLWRGNGSGTAEPALAARKWVNATSSWGAWTAIVAVSSYVNGQKQVCTKGTSDGAIHTVVITGSTGAIRHYKRSGSAPFDTVLISASITGIASHTRVGLGVNSNTLFIVYDKGDNKLYGRVFDGTSWGTEGLIKGDATVIQGALSVSDADGGGNHLIVWNEGSVSPYALTAMVHATGPTGAGDTISPSAAAVAASMSDAALVQTHVLVPSGVTASASIQSAALTQTHVLMPAGMAASAAMSVASVSTGDTISLSAAAVAASMSDAALVQTHVLVPSGVTASASIQSAALTQTHVLMPAGMAVSAAMSVASVSTGGGLGTITNMAIISMTTRRDIAGITPRREIAVV